MAVACRFVLHIFQLNDHLSAFVLPPFTDSVVVQFVPFLSSSSPALLPHCHNARSRIADVECSSLMRLS